MSSFKTVWTNGCFDVLHRGHFELFKYAKDLGDYLLVGVDSDKKVKIDKGPSRPINCAEDRKFALESIRYIDSVVIFDSRDDLENILSMYMPDIMVIGSDWKDKEVIGSCYTQELCFFDRISLFSTTNILERL